MTLEEVLQLATKYKVLKMKLMDEEHSSGKIVSNYEFELHPDAFRAPVDFSDIKPISQPIGAQFGNPTEDEVLFYSTVQEEPKQTDQTDPLGQGRQQ